jgi:hypothetical protein
MALFGLPSGRWRLRGRFGALLRGHYRDGIDDRRAFAALSALHRRSDRIPKARSIGHGLAPQLMESAADVVAGARQRRRPMLDALVAHLDHAAGPKIGPVAALR